MFQSKAPASAIRTLLIDNYDSYTFNLFQALKDVNGVEPILVQNDDFGSSWETLCHHLIPGTDFQNVVISPGPGSPSVAADVGICMEALRACIYVHKIPVLGVCLGHQMLAHMHGAAVTQMCQPMHGRLSKVRHNGFDDLDSIFYGIPSGFSVVRYHSLAVTPFYNEDLPNVLKVQAVSSDKVIRKSTNATMNKNSISGNDETPSMVDEVDVIMSIQVQPTSDFEFDLNFGVDNNAKNNTIVANAKDGFAPCWGVQFHPESISTEYGDTIIANFKRITENYWNSACELVGEDESCFLKQKESEKEIFDEDFNVHTDELPSIDNEKENTASNRNGGILFVRELVLGENQSVDKPEEAFKFIGSGSDPSVNSSRCAFWLDSATCNWSNDTPNENEGDEKQMRGRFSYMGNGDGPYSKLVEFFVDPNYRSLSAEHPFDGSFGNLPHRLKVSCKVEQSNEWKVIEEPENDIFSYLDIELGLLKKKSKLNHTKWCCLRNIVLNEVEKNIEDWEGDFDFLCGYVGFLGYGLRRLCDVKSCGVESAQNMESLPRPISKPNNFQPSSNAKAQCNNNDEYVPDAAFLFADRVIVWDHLVKKAYLLVWTENDGEAVQAAQEWMSDIQKSLVIPEMKVKGNPNQYQCQPEEAAPLSPEEIVVPNWDATNDKEIMMAFTPDDAYLKQIEKCLDLIKMGETYEVCLTKQLYSKATVDPTLFYRLLREINPAPYGAFFEMNPVISGASIRIEHINRKSSFAICSSSPERFLRVSKNGTVESKPIKGTIKRGRNVTEDLELAETLRSNVKDRAENLMIVDLVRNDLGRVCTSVSVPKLMQVETYETVHQLVSTVTGCIDTEKYSTLQTIRAAFPGGSMTGAPKLRTMKIIDETEPCERGVYSGSLGFLSINGAADLNIVIRTAVVTPNGITVGTGGAIVTLSDPIEELTETKLKAKALNTSLWTYIKRHGSPI